MRVLLSSLVWYWTDMRVNLSHHTTTTRDPVKGSGHNRGLILWVQTALNLRTFLAIGRHLMGSYPVILCSEDNCHQTGVITHSYQLNPDWGQWGDPWNETLESVSLQIKKLLQNLKILREMLENLLPTKEDIRSFQIWTLLIMKCVCRGVTHACLSTPDPGSGYMSIGPLATCQAVFSQNNWTLTD